MAMLTQGPNFTVWGSALGSVLAQVKGPRLSHQAIRNSVNMQNFSPALNPLGSAGLMFLSSNGALAVPSLIRMNQGDPPFTIVGKSSTKHYDLGFANKSGL